MAKKKPTKAQRQPTMADKLEDLSNRLGIVEGLLFQLIVTQATSTHAENVRSASALRYLRYLEQHLSISIANRVASQKPTLVLSVKPEASQYHMPTTPLSKIDNPPKFTKRTNRS